MRRRGEALGNVYLWAALAAAGLSVISGGCYSGDDTGGTGGTGGNTSVRDPKRDTCQCYMDVGIIPEAATLLTECVSNVPVACVTCVDGVRGGADCNDLSYEDFNGCVDDCKGLLAPPTTTEACKSMMGSFGTIPVGQSVTDCMCDKCRDAFAACIVDHGCLLIIECIAERNCEPIACLTDEVCGPLIENVGAVYPDSLTNLVMPVAECNSTYQCRPDPLPAAGAGGAGAGGG